MTLPQDSIGTVLGGRYRLVALLGAGRTASVFLAEDLSLQRQVAARMLHADHAQDPAMRGRFVEEARAVAALNHPSILRVYDWGEDETTPYVIQEYLAGGSLRQLLDRQGQLPLAQVVAIGAQAAQGLAYAHARGLVHGDLKPSNLLFDEDGRVRVTDFGSVDGPLDPFALDDAALDPERVAFASPEEALGTAIDGRSDVYSLALICYLAATGTPAFSAGAPVATLMARIGVALPHHPALGPLDAVLARASAPEREARLDAAQFADRLEALGPSLGTADPLPLGAGTVAVASVTASTLGFRPPSADELTQSVPIAATAAAPVVAATAAQPASAAPPPSVTTPAPEASPAPDATEAGDPSTPGTKSKSGRKRWPWIVGIIVAVLVAAGIGLWATGTFASKATVPNLVGEQKNTAIATASAAGLNLTFTTAPYQPGIPADQVASQSPAPGTSVKQGSSVAVALSPGAPLVSVPQISGLTCDQAKAALDGAKLIGTCPAGAAVVSATIAAGRAVSYSYNGQQNPPQVPEGATVTVALSSGPPPTAVPSVAGQSLAAAQATLQSAGFQSVDAQEYSSTIAAGSVTRTQPVAGAMLQKGATVTIFVSQGPAPVPVPSVVGDTVSQAVAALTAAGLEPSVNGATGTVISSTPAAGTLVKRGSIVTITVQ